MSAVIHCRLSAYRRELAIIKPMPAHFRDGSLVLSAHLAGGDDQEMNARYYEQLVSKLEHHINRLEALLHAGCATSPAF